MVVFAFSIDVDKKQIDQIKDLYKSLYKIASLQEENQDFLNYAKESISETASSMTRSRGEGLKLEDFSTVNEYIFDWKMKKHRDFVRSDFGDVFDKFIKN